MILAGSDAGSLTQVKDDKSKSAEQSRQRHDEIRAHKVLK